MPEASTRVCQNCGKPSGSKSRCPDCMAATKKSVKARRKRLREQGLCFECGKKKAKSRCDDCQQKIRDREQAVRREVLDHYGGVCACCGEATFEFLQLDHVAGGGTRHHKSLTISLARHLKKSGFPRGIRFSVPTATLPWVSTVIVLTGQRFDARTGAVLRNQQMAHQVKAEYKCEISVWPPGFGGPVLLNVWMNPETNQLVAVSNMDLPVERNYIPDPYQDGVHLVFEDTFSGLPK